MDYWLNEAADGSDQRISLLGSMILGEDSRHVVARFPIAALVASSHRLLIGVCGITELAVKSDSKTAWKNSSRTLVAVFREARRVLCDDGTLWLNIGDGYTSGEPRLARS